MLATAGVLSMPLKQEATASGELEPKEHRSLRISLIKIARVQKRKLRFESRRPPSYYQLPFPCWKHIFSYLPPQSLLNFALSSRDGALLVYETLGHSLGEAQRRNTKPWQPRWSESAWINSLCQSLFRLYTTRAP